MTVTSLLNPPSSLAILSTLLILTPNIPSQVIRMLFVVVVEFFVCWAPLHVLNTWYLFYPDTVYKYVGSSGVSLVQLLAYISSCCNPITYCFMNRKFRQAFLGIFNLYKWQRYAILTDYMYHTSIIDNNMFHYLFNIIFNLEFNTVFNLVCFLK